MGKDKLFLELDKKPMIQHTIHKLKKYFKKIIIDTFEDENSDINPYYPTFKSHQLIIEDTGLNFKVSFSIRCYTLRRINNFIKTRFDIRRRQRCSIMEFYTSANFKGELCPAFSSFRN